MRGEQLRLLHESASLLVVVRSHRHCSERWWWTAAVTDHAYPPPLLQYHLFFYHYCRIIQQSFYSRPATSIVHKMMTPRRCGWDSAALAPVQRHCLSQAASKYDMRMLV